MLGFVCLACGNEYNNRQAFASIIQIPPDFLLQPDQEERNYIIIPMNGQRGFHRPYNRKVYG